MERVCARCFSDTDIRQWIDNQDGPRGCDACGRHDASTIGLSELGDFLRGRISQYYGLAVDQLPYDSAEGGYQGTTWDTGELLDDLGALDFARSVSGLELALVDAVGWETWCEYDWLSLDLDQELLLNWERFCKIVKHQRRFFFHNIADPDDREQRSPAELLHFVADFAYQQGMVRTISRGTPVYRARPLGNRRFELTAAELGPPPAQRAVQANRMNPAGIPMMYVAEKRKTALAEIPPGRVAVGKFELIRDIRLVDLACLPPIPGVFSNASRQTRLGCKFLHMFRDAIVKPVARDKRVHIDYLPSQVVTEFIRGHRFGGLNVVDGIRYPSVAHADGINWVLFATPRDVSDGTHSVNEAWIRLTDARVRNVTQ